MFNYHELLVAQLGNLQNQLRTIRTRELKAAEERIEQAEAGIHSQIGDVLKRAILEGVPIGQIRATVGAKNWKTWARIKRRYGVLEGTLPQDENREKETER